MAERISINIDLRHSKRVLSQPDNNHNFHNFKNKHASSRKYHYHYDRIAFVLTTVFILIFTVYLYLFPEKKVSNQVSLNSTEDQEVITTDTVKHINASDTEQVNQQALAIYLNYESVNVLETFSFQISELVPPVTNIERNEVSYQVINKQSVHETDTIESDFITVFSDTLSRVLLVENVYKKEPVNEFNYHITGKENQAKKVYLFTQVDNSIGDKLIHQWWYQNRLISQKIFTIQGKRWRCFSSKNLGNLQQGHWLIKVLNNHDKVLATVNFEYHIK